MSEAWCKHDRRGPDHIYCAECLREEEEERSEKRIAELEAELATPEGRRCEGCKHVRHHSVGKPHEYRLCHLGNSFGYDAALPATFYCSEWTAREETSPRATTVAAFLATFCGGIAVGCWAAARGRESAYLEGAKDGIGYATRHAEHMQDPTYSTEEPTT